MTEYLVEVQPWWLGEWLPMGKPLRISAKTPAAALAQVDRASIDLRHGIPYRLTVSGGELRVALATETATFPEFPELQRAEQCCPAMADGHNGWCTRG